MYYHERLLEGTVNEDSGAEIRDGMKVLQQIGVPPEYLDPYIISHFKNKPSILAEKAAAKYKISKYYRVNTLNDMKLALAEGLPVVIGIAVYDSFESDEVAKTGIVPMPNINTENLLGGHCMCISGFDDSKQWVITRNSWSTNWGDKGYCYLPYSFIIDSNLTIDMWTGF